MSQTSKGKDERVFTIELKSRDNVKNVTLDGGERVSIEGSLGRLKRAEFVEDLVLEVIGSNGELRIDLGMNDLRTTESKKVGGSRQ